MLIPNDRSFVRRFKENTSATLLLLAAVMFLATGCGNCKSSSSEAMPTDSAARAEHLTSQLPTKTEMIVLAGDLEQMQQTLGQAKDRMESFWPMVSLLQKQVQSEFGIDILSSQSWQQAGVAPKGGMVLASVQGRPVLLTYVDDRQAFEKNFVDRLKRTFNIEAPTRAETHEGRQYKLAGTTPSQDIAWFYEGKLAVVAMPAYGTIEGLEGGTALVVASQVARTKKAESLNKDADFQRFYKAMGKEHPVSVYLNAKSYLNSAQFAQSQDQLRAPFGLVADWSKENAQGVGFGIKAEQAQVRIQALAITDETVRERANKAQRGASSMDWEHLATSNTFAGLRTSIDFPAFWALYLESMPRENQQLVRRQLKQIGASFEVDVEEDILAAISGNVGIFFYGVHVPSMMQAMSGDIFDVLRAAGVIVSVQFTETEKLDALVEKAQAAGQGLIAVRPLVDGDKNPVESIRVLEIKNVQSTPGALYIKGDTVTFASSALSEEAVHLYLTGARTEGKLKEVEALDLGARFSSAEQFNGFYVNFIRARANIGSAIPLPSVQQVLGQLEELLIEVEITDDGFLGTATLDMAKPTQAQQ
ncbi:MAG: hypothetical protein ACNA8W_15770 [Bradymonadaceae bacterium]